MTVRVPLGHTSGIDNVGESAELAAKPHEAARRHKLVRNVSSELLGEHRTVVTILEAPALLVVRGSRPQLDNSQ